MTSFHLPVLDPFTVLAVLAGGVLILGVAIAVALAARTCATSVRRDGRLGSPYRPGRELHGRGATGRVAG